MPAAPAEPLSRRRQQILGTAERLLKHYGFAKTTVADIAREAGVGVGTVYLEFASKEALVGELALERHRQVLQRMSAAAGRRGSHAARLRWLVEERLQALSGIAQDGQHGSDLLDCACAAVREVHQRFCAEEEELLAGLLEAAGRAGEFAAVASPAVVARVVLRLYDGYLGRTGAAQAEQLEAVHRLVLRGLLRR